MSESYEALIVEQRGPVARLILNRPDKLNTFNGVLRREMMSAVAALNGDPSIRVVVLSGAGRAFCAGADLLEPTGRDESDVGPSTEHMLKTEYKPSLMGIAESPKLWIGAVGGAAAGIGSAYMMSCDLVVMGEGSYLYQAFAAIGLIPDGGATWQLLHAVGRKRAFEIIVGGERVYAEECRRLGLCNRVVADGDEEENALAWADTLARKAPLAVQYSKKALAMAGSMSLEEIISQEAAMQNICISSEDSREGVLAFFEKREPMFTGR